MSSEPDLEELAGDIDRQIQEADREAATAAYAFALGDFDRYWSGYLAKAQAGLEKTYADLTGSPTDGGNRQAGE